jgi:hypothetical protein
MKRIFLCSIALSVALTVTAQGHREFGITIKSGLGEIKKISNEKVFQSRLNEIATEPAFSWGISVGGIKKFENKIALESQIEYNYLEGKETEQYATYHFNSDPTLPSWQEFIKAETFRKAHYLTIISRLNFHPTEKLSMGVGFSMHYMLTNSAKTDLYINHVKTDLTTSSNDLNSLDFGINPKLSYQIFDRINLIGQANIGLYNQRLENSRDIYSTNNDMDSGHEYKLKNRQFTIGITYVFFKDKT